MLGAAGLGSAACAYEVYPIANRAIANLTGTAKPAAKPRGPASPSDAKAKTAGVKANVATAGTTKVRPANNGNRCRTLPALQPLDQLPAATIFTLVDLGPRLIAVTHHSAISGPYHRNGTAILDIHHAFDGSPETFRKIAAAHGATYLLVCPGFAEGTIYQARSRNGFYARVLRGEKFDFLEPVTLKFPGDAAL